MSTVPPGSPTAATGVPTDLATTSRLVVDLAAVRHNVRVLRAAAPGAQLMAVVKADAYGHGRGAVARAALEAGATWLGAAQLTEALALRGEVGPLAVTGARILSWLIAPGAPVGEALEADVDLSVSAPWALEEVADAARRAGRPARIHLKVDTGMGRQGVAPQEFAALAARARRLAGDGLVEVVAVWSHLARADEVGETATQRQDALLREALASARRVGLDPIAHLAASSGILWHPHTHHDLVRAGIALYGISPEPEVATAAELGLRPALRWEADLTLVKRLPAGSPVSYGATEVLDRDTWVGIVPVGYADGVPRHASSRGPVRVGDHQGRVLGRVCMDQVVVDLGPAGAAGEPPPAAPGDRAVLLAGAADQAAGPSAEDWARAADTIGYEIVTRVGARVPRVVIDRERAAGAPQEGGQMTDATLSVIVPDAESMRDLGAALAGVLRAGDLVLLSGELGAGKTTLTQGLGRGLGVRGQVASPTFVLAREHAPTGEGPGLVHVDAYRLDSLEEVDALDLDSSLEECVTVVEWGTGKVEDLAADRLEIELRRPGAQEAASTADLDLGALAAEAPREVVVRPVGPRWAQPAARGRLTRALGVSGS